MKGNKSWVLTLLIGLAVFGVGRAVAQVLAEVELEAVVEVAADARPDVINSADNAAEKKSKTAGLGERNEREITLGQQLSFKEEQVREEMAELEQRMFRLSEALLKHEPENSSRLKLGLKYAREELILHQMKEVQEALARLSLQGAAEEQKQLLVKLDRLQQLLLSTDLDFEMRLERLRQIRDTLRQLDTVIREESRQERVSRMAADAEKRLEKLAQRKATLEDLIHRQGEHIEQNAPFVQAESLSQQQRDDIGQLREAQDTTRQTAKALADELQDGATPKNLFGAVENMQLAVEALADAAADKAQPPMEKALAQLKEELDDVGRQEAEAKQALAEEKFAAMRKDQEGNRRANDDVIDRARELGSSGTAALGELLRATGNMAGAEGAFGDAQASSGNGEQGKALASLQYARELLAEEAERLARELRREVKKRVTEGLQQMLEMQTAVRERTEALAPGVKAGSREALAALAALAKREEKITATAQELINIVEETEFGIALPAALAAVRDATEGVQISLAAGDASSQVVKAEKQIEEDLKAMIDVVEEMTDANSRRGRRGGNSPEEQRRELNRIISELKMIRLLELRVRQNTIDVDARREATASLSSVLRRQIEHLEGRQSDIREATEILALERGDELPESE